MDGSLDCTTSAQSTERVFLRFCHVASPPQRSHNPLPTSTLRHHLTQLPKPFSPKLDKPAGSPSDFPNNRMRPGDDRYRREFCCLYFQRFVGVSFDIERKEDVRHFSSEPVGTPLVRVKLSEKGRRLALLNMSRQVTIWDAETGEQLGRRSLDVWPTSLVFSPDGDRLLIGNTDRTATQWSYH